MTRNVLPREFDVDRMLKDYERRIAFLERSRFGVGYTEADGDFTVSAGYSGSAELSARKIGPLVSWTGVISPDTDWGPAMSNHNILAMPDELVPESSAVVPASSQATSVVGPFRLVANATNGLVQVRCDIGSHTSGVYMASLIYLV